MAKTTKTDPIPDTNPTEEAAAPAVIETTVLDALPADVLPPVNRAPKIDTTYDDEIIAVLKDRKYRLSNVHGEAERKTFRRKINAAVRRLGVETDRTKFIDHANGLYWTVYVGKIRTKSEEAAEQADNG